MRSSSTESKKCNKMSHGLHKQLKDCVGRFFRILYRLVSFSLIFVEVILMILKKSFVTILQPGYIIKKLYQKSKIPLKLCHSFWKRRKNMTARQILAKKVQNRRPRSIFSWKFCYFCLKSVKICRCAANLTAREPKNCRGRNFSETMLKVSVGQSDQISYQILRFDLIWSDQNQIRWGFEPLYLMVIWWSQKI